MKRFSRPLCLLLSLIIFGTFLVVPSSAATNLVNPDLSEWENTSREFDDTQSFVMRVISINSGDLFLLQPSYAGDVDGKAFYMSFALDTVILKAGNSYTFSLHIPSFNEIRSKSTYQLTDEQFVNKIGDGWNISFCTRDSSGSITDDISFLTITKDNYSSLQGTDYVCSFECPDYSGSNPIIMITGSNLYSNNWLFLDSSMMLVDNNEEDEEGFFSRLFDWFQARFDDLSSWFSNLGDRLYGFFVDLADSLEQGLNGLLDGIGGWFQKLGNLILYLTWSDEVPDNPFQSEDGPLDKVEGFFDGLIDYLRNIKTDLLNVIDSVTAGIHVFDLFTERFPWVKSLCLFAFALIIFSRFVGL